MKLQEKLAVLIADDHAVIRLGLRLIISDMHQMYVHHEAKTYQEVHHTLEQNLIHLLIIDIGMPGGDHISAIESIKLNHPELKIIIFSSYPEHIYAARYLKAGADAYLHKDAGEEIIKKEIFNVLHSPRGLQAKPAHISNHSDTLSILSDRELDVANLLSNGLGNLEIANMLDLKMTTVSTYKKRIFEKLGVANLPDLIKLLNIDTR